jgi:sugar O-acyltransferase (sialic acid O-acetyltransferase NeuD family)
VRILIVGAGGHAQVVADIILSAVSTDNNLEIVGFVDDKSALWGDAILGLPVLGPTIPIPDIAFDAAVIAVGDNSARMALYLHYQTDCGCCFPIIIHPSAVIGRNVEIGQGTVIVPGAIVNTGSKIGCNTILNTACSVGHHNIIGDHAHVGPGAHLAGATHVGEGSFIGIGAIAVPQSRIGAWATVGAGAVVTRPVEDGQTVVGVPARPLAARTSRASILSRRD